MKVKKSFQGKIASKKPNNRLRSILVELKEALHVLFEMASKQPNLVGGENKGGKAREKDRDAMEALQVWP